MNTLLPHASPRKAAPPSFPPFAWQDKRILRKIREAFDDANTAASALGTYFALTVVASDKETEEFQTTHHWLAQLGGLSERTVRSRIADLERLNVIAVATPPLRAPSTYRLLPFGNGCPPSGNGCRAFGNGEAPPLPPSELKRRGGSVLAAEFPRGFPGTEGEGVTHAGFVGCPEEFARRVWLEAASRNGFDCFGQPVRQWRHYLAARWASDQSRSKERRPTASKAPKFTTGEIDPSTL